MFTLGTSCSSLQDDVRQRPTPEAGRLLHAKQKNKENDILTLGPAPSLSSVLCLSLLSHTSRLYRRKNNNNVSILMSCKVVYTHYSRRASMAVIIMHFYQRLLCSSGYFRNAIGSTLLFCQGSGNTSHRLHPTAWGSLAS